MAADASSSKKRKITDLRASVPFCTQTALAAICKEIAEGGLPEQHSRFSIWNEAKQFLEDHSMSMYGPLFQSVQATTLNNEKVAFLFINCLSLLSGIFNQAGEFTDFLLDKHARQPSSLAAPWQAVCYSDEVHPGNILNSTSRKCWRFYISFLELGHLLSRSDLWFCISILRSSEVATLQAGYSQVFRHILEHIFGDGTATTGVLLKSSKGNLRLHFSLGMRQCPQAGMGQSPRHWQQAMLPMQQYIQLEGCRKHRRRKCQNLQQIPQVWAASHSNRWGNHC